MSTGARARAFLWGGAAMLAFAVPAAAAAQGLPCLINCFSVSGRKGHFVDTVNAKQVEQARETIRGDGGQSKGISEHAVNKGDFQGYGLSMPQTEAKLGELVEEIRTAIRSKWPELDPGPMRVRLIGSTSYGPRAMADNTIVVPIGLIVRAQYDDEIVWVLSHEISHLALAHFARDAALEKRKQAIDQITRALTTALELSRLRSQNTTSGVHLYMVDNPEEVKRVKAAEALQLEGRLMASLQGEAVSREQEDQADIAGADFALAANREVEDASSAAYQRIKEDDERLDRNAASSQALIQDLAASSVKPQTVTTLSQGNISGAANDFIGEFVRNAGAVLMQKGVAYLSANHRSPQQRKAGMHRYLEDAYKDLDSRNLTTKTVWLTAVRNLDEYKAADAAVQAHDRAANLLEQKKPNEAVTELQPTLAGPYGHSPYIANMAAKIYDAVGDYVRADQIYDEAENPPRRPPPVVRPVQVAAAAPSSRGARGAPGKRKAPAPAAAPPPVAPPPPEPVAAPDAYLQQSLDGYGEHVELLTAHGLYPKAMAKVAEAEHRFGDHETLLPAMIFIDVKTGKEDAADAALDECKKTENDALWEKCKYAIYDESQKAEIDRMSPAQRAKLDHSLERKREDNGRAQDWKHLMDGLNGGQNPPKT